MRLVSLRTLALSALAAAACASQNDSVGPTDTLPSPGGRDSTSTLPGRTDTLPASLSVAERQTVASSNGFGLTLFQRVNARRAGQNVFISPYSAAVALGMTLNGAAGTTADAMARTLGFAGQSLGEIDAAYRALGQRLARADTGVRFESANSIWYNRDLPFHQAFFDTTAKYFGAQVEGLNFRDEQAALGRINGWARERTSGRIEKVLDQIRADDQAMFLLNALYFKADWASQFDSRLTQKADFTKADGSKQSVDMMSQRHVLPVWRASDLTAVELPYSNGAYAMVVLLPAEGRSVDQLVASLDAARWKQVTDSLRPGDIQLYLPRFTMRYEDEWKDVLSAMGMSVAFSRGGADFTRMSPRGRDMFIEFVKQNTFVGVNERGTEAGAVTTVGIGVVSLPPQVRVDRAFAFVIREKGTGALLFAGKVAQVPAGS
jgi:serine protease inhibitor